MYKFQEDEKCINELWNIFYKMKWRRNNLNEENRRNLGAYNYYIKYIVIHKLLLISLLQKGNSNFTAKTPWDEWISLSLDGKSMKNALISNLLGPSEALATFPEKISFASSVESKTKRKSETKKWNNMKNNKRLRSINAINQQI